MIPSDLLLYFLQVPTFNILWIFNLAKILVIVVTIGNGTPNSSGNLTPSVHPRIVFPTIQLWINGSKDVPIPTCSFKSCTSNYSRTVSLGSGCSLDHGYSLLNRQFDPNFTREFDAIPRLWLQAVQQGTSAIHLWQYCSFKSSHKFKPLKSH